MGGPAVEGTYPHWPSVATLLRAPRDPVANFQLVAALGKQPLTRLVPKLPRQRFEPVLAAIDTVLGR
jgi:hypothetical protein